MPETDLEEWVYSLKKYLHILYKKSLDGPRYHRECVRGHRDATGTKLYRKAECIITEKDTFFHKHVHWLIAHVTWWVAQRWPQRNVISLSFCLHLARAGHYSPGQLPDSTFLELLKSSDYFLPFVHLQSMSCAFRFLTASPVPLNALLSAWHQSGAATFLREPSSGWKTGCSAPLSSFYKSDSVSFH